MAPPTHEYTTHNFDAVNSYVNEMSERHHLANSVTRASLFSTYAKWTAVVLVALGLTGFLGLWGYSLLTEKPEPKIITTERIIERPITLEPRIILSPNQGDAAGIKEVRNEANDRIKKLSEDAKPFAPGPKGEGTKPIYNYTIFKIVPFDVGGLEKITVGMRYADNNAAKPFEQWCYVIVGNPDGTQRHLDLAFKSTRNGFEKPSLTYSQASSMKTSMEKLRAAQALCPFE